MEIDRVVVQIEYFHNVPVIFEFQLMMHRMLDLLEAVDEQILQVNFVLYLMVE